MRLKLKVFVVDIISTCYFSNNNYGNYKVLTIMVITEIKFTFRQHSLLPFCLLHGLINNKQSLLLSK